MSHLKSKSEFNLEAAKVLIDEHTFYASSVHCSYYGCFQHIKSKLNRIGITYEKMDADISAAEHLFSNKYPIDLIVKEVTEKSDRYAGREVKDKIKKLKAFRVISDYHNVMVDHSGATGALNLSKEIINLIDKKL